MWLRKTTFLEDGATIKSWFQLFADAFNRVWYHKLNRIRWFCRRKESGGSKRTVFDSEEPDSNASRNEQNVTTEDINFWHFLANYRSKSPLFHSTDGSPCTLYDSSLAFIQLFRFRTKLASQTIVPLFLIQKSQIRTLPETSKMWLRKTFSLDVFHQLFAFFVQTKQNKSRSGPVMDRRMLVSIKRGTYSAEP